METVTATVVAKIVWINEFTMHKWLTLPISSFVHALHPTLFPTDPQSQNMLQQFDFTFVWINEFTMAFTNYWHLSSSPLCTNLILHHIQPIHEGKTHPTTSAFCTTKCLWFCAICVSQQQMKISDWYFCGALSSNTLPNQFMSPDQMFQQVLFQTRNVCGFMNLLCGKWN